jgi:integrase
MLDYGAHVRCYGKGRKERVTPLTKPTVAVLRPWLVHQPGEPGDPLFPANHGGKLSRDAVERLLAKHAAAAAVNCPTLGHKRVSPHVLRHYVDGWVMWPAGVFPVLGLAPGPVPAT